MKLLSVKLVTLGNLKCLIDFKRIESWPSQIFKVALMEQLQALPNAEGPDWAYTDAQLKRLVRPSDDLTLAIINAPLEGNYYLRHLGTIAVLSLHETAVILRSSNLRIEDFVVRNLYELCAWHIAPDCAPTIVHDETRSCLFDMNAYKTDIQFSTGNPTICHQCKARLMQAQVDKDFLPLLEKELKQIKKDLYYRIADWVKVHPKLTLGITAGSAFLLNVLANVIYDLWIRRLIGQ